MKELEEGMDGLEKELTILLLPRDPADDKNGALIKRKAPPPSSYSLFVSPFRPNVDPCTYPHPSTAQ